VKWFKILQSLFYEIQAEMAGVEEKLNSVVQTPDLLVTEAATHLLKAGGKRLRPAFCILSGKCGNFNFEKILPVAAAVELTHMASLVHDDVVDSALVRRGTLTIKAKWGNKLSVHVGSYLFAESLKLISNYDKPIIKILANTGVKMCVGEIEQIKNGYNWAQPIKDYFSRISRKTALLIATCCQLGALVCEAPRKLSEALRRYGHYVGMAFQITDDILDFVAKEQQLGKPVGSDLQQGVITLPTIYALKHSPAREDLKNLLSLLSTQNDAFILDKAVEIIKNSGGIGHAQEIAWRYLVKAKNELAFIPEQPAKKNLTMIADYIGKREY
jgi:heptaprenyl diphosphate synthase